MSNFIEIVEGFGINVESIISVKDNGDGSLTIDTEGKEYKVRGRFKLFVDFLNQEKEEDKKVRKFTEQFFGG